MSQFIVVFQLHGNTQEVEVGPFATEQEIDSLACWPQPNHHTPLPGWIDKGPTEPKPLCQDPTQIVAGEKFQKTGD